MPGLITVAVTGPTGEIGKPFVDALERTPEVGRVLAMARRPFDPSERGWRKTEYHRGDILDRDAVRQLVQGADAVVHLAFIVVQATKGTYDINVEGSRNVFEETVSAGVSRLLYTSSVAAYGYDHERELPLTEATPAHGTDRHAYSHQKAEVERLLSEALTGGQTVPYVFRPCVVAGPQAPALLTGIPYLQVSERLPGPLRGAFRRIPLVRPVLPDHGMPFQLVHHDDVASALVAAVLGRGAPGVYNLAGPGELTVAELARELGWRSVPIPRQAVTASARMLGQVPLTAAAVAAGWLEALRCPMIMDCTRARTQLGWEPRHDALATLRELIAAVRPGR
jgi:nucleoside-diphosphate-sugar epimerase